MYNTDMPNRADLPTSAQLVRSTAVALIAASAILLFVVLPSEYGIDPTGVGRVFGLTQMGEIKVQLAAEAAAEAERSAQETDAGGSTTDGAADRPAVRVVDAGEAPRPDVAAGARSDEISFALEPGQGAEYKLAMRKGSRARFSWTAGGGVVNFDAHGSAPGQRASYGTGRGVAGDEGEIEAAFDGNHGWFFRNRTEKNVTVTLRTSGDYTELRRIL